MKTAHDWAALLQQCGVTTPTAGRWGVVFAGEITEASFSKGPAEVPVFLGQILHESGMLERLTENLNYSATRLMQVWPKRFPTLESAVPYERNPQRLAERVYGGRMGNDTPGDGARYIGRGLMMVTGKNNYRAVGKVLGLDLLNKPELLATPAVALKSAIAWWEGNVPDSELHDDRMVTRRVNGGEIGLSHRTALADMAREALA